MPDFQIPSTTGMVLTPSQIVSGQNGTNISVGYVTRPVAGQLLSTQGTGEFAIRHIGTRGIITAEVVVGATGSARAIVKVTSALSSPLSTIQISLDSSNRPAATIAYNGTVTASAPSGSALAAGSRVQVQLAWDAEATLPGGGHVEFKQLNGAPVLGTFGTLPVAPWTTVPMGFVQVGYGTGLSDFNGTILSIQVGDLSGVSRPATPTSVFTTEYYVDSLNGDDANNGASQGQAFQTLGRLYEEDLGGKDIYLAKGSRFREELTGLPLGCKIRAYGSGARPIIDGRDIANNASFTKTVGRTNVYQISWAHGFDSSKCQHRVWQSGVMMTRAANLTACDSTPGSFWADTPTAGGPDLVYVHPTGSTPPTLEYAITRRRYCIQLYQHFNQANIIGLEAIGNAYADGSLLTDGYAEDCIARDGRVHNAFILGLAVNIQALGIELGSDATMFVSYVADGQFGGPAARNTIYRGCVADAQQSAAIGAGYFSHTDGIRFFGTLQYEDCNSIGCATAYSGGQAAIMLYYRCTHEDTLIAFSSRGETRTVILGGAGALRPGVSNNSKLFHYTTVQSLNVLVHGTKIYKIGTGVGPIFSTSALGVIQVERCTIVSASSATNQVDLGTLIFRRNVVTGGNFQCMRIGTVAVQITEYDADENCYWVPSLANGAFRKQFGGATDYITLVSWRAYLATQSLGPETASITVDPQLANPAALNFTIGNPTVLSLGAGAEPDEENDPELQAYWDQYRVG